jgi:hypothetical protein
LGRGVRPAKLLQEALEAADRGPLGDQHVRPANAEQVVDVLEWFNSASGHVPRLTQSLQGFEQTVELSGQGQNFPVLPLGD